VLSCSLHSPFFQAFAGGLVRDESIANAIFAFTDAIPGATIGAAFQTISLLRWVFLFLCTAASAFCTITLELN
jgi:hypothetical protein